MSVPPFIGSSCWRAQLQQNLYNYMLQIYNIENNKANNKEDIMF